ncbi:MAG: hypothetical protein JST26_15040 [Bacteroidetes bacterium]|nr:hypothetical protein [Bacteroidota bacterium]
MTGRFRLIITAIACVLWSLCFAQSTHGDRQATIDSLRNKLSADSIHIFRFQNVRPFVGIDQRNSWIKNEHGAKNTPINVNGLQLGTILKEKHTVGIGLYSISNTAKQPVRLQDKNQVVTYQQLDIKYMTLFYQYAIVDRRYFELDLPLEVGLRSYKYYLTDANKQVQLHREQGTVKLTGGGVNIIIKPFRWIGVSGMAGLRFVLVNQHTNLNFNGAYYSYGVWLDIRQIIRDTRYYLIKKPRYKKQIKQLLLQ